MVVDSVHNPGGQFGVLVCHWGLLSGSSQESCSHSHGASPRGIGNEMVVPLVRRTRSMPRNGLHSKEHLKFQKRCYQPDTGSKSLISRECTHLSGVGQLDHFKG